MSVNINLEDDIPGCEDNYYRCVMTCLRVSRGWIDFFSTIILFVAAILSSVLASNYSNQNLIMILGIIIAALTGATAGFRILKDFTVSEESQIKELLKQIISEYNNTNDPKIKKLIHQAISDHDKAVI